MAITDNTKDITIDDLAELNSNIKNALYPKEYAKAVNEIKKVMPSYNPSKISWYKQGIEEIRESKKEQRLENIENTKMLNSYFLSKAKDILPNQYEERKKLLRSTYTIFKIIKGISIDKYYPKTVEYVFSNIKKLCEANIESDLNTEEIVKEIIASNPGLFEKTGKFQQQTIPLEEAPILTGYNKFQKYLNQHPKREN
jgi:hypothetical protein